MGEIKESEEMDNLINERDEYALKNSGQANSSNLNNNYTSIHGNAVLNTMPNYYYDSITDNLSLKENELDDTKIENKPSKEHNKEYAEKLNNIISSNASTLIVDDNSASNLNNNLTISSNGEKITSNLEFIKENVATINSRIDKNINFLIENHSFNSIKDNNAVYDKTNNMMKKYYATQKQLMEKLKTETKFILNAGEVLERLDEQLMKEADKL